ncbi:19067_t:CDS:2 [Funneliformis geosporum]|nr:19067_t:CDS:2 [Funneliformis geosporum]
MINPLPRRYMRSDATKLSSADYKDIMQYQDMKSKPLDQLRKRFYVSTSRAIVTAGKPLLAFGATGALSTGSHPAMDQSSSHVPFGIISAPVVIPAPILPILVAALPWNPLVVFKLPI